MEKTYPRIFKKAVKCTVGGKMLLKRGGAYLEDEFLLRGDPMSSPVDEISIEVADAEAEKYFIKHNKNAIVNGYLVEITEGYEMVLDEVNAVSDGFLKDLLKEPYAKLKKRIDKFTSPVPVTRLLDFALADDRPYKTVEMIKAKLAQFNTPATPKKTAEMGNVKVGTA
jgi:hypothetical protein